MLRDICQAEENQPLTIEVQLQDSPQFQLLVSIPAIRPVYKLDSKGYHREIFENKLYSRFFIIRNQRPISGKRDKHHVHAACVPNTKQLHRIPA